MVRPRLTHSFEPRRLRRGCLRRAAAWIWTLGLLVLCAGCALAPRSQRDECQQLSRTLRSENARLKDQLLTLEAENRDYAERALDDSRRLAAQDEAIERLDHSVQAYQDERGRLESAYRQLASSLGETGAGSDERLSHASPAVAPKNKPRSQSTSREAKDRGDDQPDGSRR